MCGLQLQTGARGRLRYSNWHVGQQFGFEYSTDRLWQQIMVKKLSVYLQPLVLHTLSVTSCFQGSENQKLVAITIKILVLDDVNNQT